MSKSKLPEDFEYLKEMYMDDYFPTHLVDKLRDAIKEVVRFIEEGGHSKDEIQRSLDKMIRKTNELQEEFFENDCEIETGAAESIAMTIDSILNYFDIDIELEEAIREREW